MTQENNRPNTAQDIPARRYWVTALTAIAKAELVSVIDRISQDYVIAHKALPQSGLAMMTLAESTQQEAFNLGEFPLASAWVSLTDKATHEEIEGAAQVLSDDESLATYIAIADAVLAHQSLGWEQVLELVQAGMEKLADTALARKKTLAATQVNFSLLDDSGSMDDE